MDSTNAIIDALDRAPRTVEALLREIPAALLTHRPQPAKWSAHEHACHLTLVDPIFRARLERMFAEDTPLIVSYNPDADESPDALLRMDLADAMADFTRHRAQFVARVRALAPADWARRAEHTEHSHYSVFIMLRHLALHDMLHAYRIEELLLNKEWAAEHDAGGARVRG
ncbi:MAG: DinB family protein [Gemmatimonadota bacterium]|nr:DinB family protein [Gemmatimonadota bacterium]